MFFFKAKEETKTTQILIRDDWGVLHKESRPKSAPILTDKELAEQLGISQTLVETHRRD
jgi:hypothetical protein